MRPLTFEALYYADRLHQVNPAGDVGVVTLWSPFPAAKRKLSEASPAIFDPDRSRVAVVANLYGDGMHAMFCNLLFNPQVRHLIAVGEDLSLPTCAEIDAFLHKGLEDAVMFGKKLKRVRGTDRFFPDLAEFDAERLRNTLSFRYLGKFSSPTLGRDLAGHLAALPRVPPGSLPDRIRVTLPEFSPDDYDHRPSQVEAHEVVRRRPLDCWEELVVRTARFGRPVRIGKGSRLELLNAKVVITDPAPDPPEALARYGFARDRFLAYEKAILDPVLPDGIAYTYGNRLRGYFPQRHSRADALDTVIRALRGDPETRRAYVSLWDTAGDLPGSWESQDTSVPCLTTIFFRRSAGRLNLTATYRSHNLLTAWLENVYGLMAIQRHVADALDLPVGSLTVVSHSLGIDPNNPRYEVARTIADGWTRDDDVDRETGKHSLREDPNGYFVLTVDDEADCIVAEHRFGGLLIKTYRSDRAAALEREIIGDMAVSLVSHAMWLGRELATKERMLTERRRGRAARQPASPSGDR
jgi:thymidylate synthase